MGIAISGWKLTKAVRVELTSKFPFVKLADKKDYMESQTKKYDQTAIKFMSIAMAPCVVGYAMYAIKYNKYRSWYSYFVSVAAGVVYTFGFVMMTPQLYINYKLKSVDHLPWRAFTYKALNTFVDDVAAFIVDMPWMHRLACFRDDVIFICYLYQRWQYRVDKTRPSEWVDTSAAAAQEQVKNGEAEATRSALTTSTSEQRPEDDRAATATLSGAAAAATGAGEEDTGLRKRTATVAAEDTM